ncbi:hypothetical protein Efla_007741 [Eimeria flavescens]
MGHWKALQQQQLQWQREQQQLLQQLHNRQQQQQQQHQREQQQREQAAEQLPSVPYACSSSSSSRSFFEWLKANDVDEQLWRCAWGAQPSSSSSSSSSPLLVVDAGSHCIRVSRVERGLEGEEQSLVLPQVIRKPWWYVGDGCFPGFRGTVTDWASYDEAILDVLAAPNLGLGLDGVGGRLLFCESSLRSPLHFAHLGELAFEMLQAERFLSVDKARFFSDTLSALAISASLLPPLSPSFDVTSSSSSSSSSSSALRVLRSMQGFTGLVVDLGGSLSRICPIICGLALGCLAVELPLGGRDIDNYMALLLLQQQQQQQGRGQQREGQVYTRPPCDCALAAARQIKEEMLCCAVEKGVVLTAERSFAAANVRTVYTPPEAFSSVDFMPLQSAIAAVIERCPVDTRKCLMQNVFVVGGTSLIPGLAARLQAELQEVYRHRKAHASFSPRVHVLPHPELQHHAAVCGGVRFGVGPLFDANNISRQQYFEYGPSLLESFSCWGPAKAAAESATAAELAAESAAAAAAAESAAAAAAEDVHSISMQSNSQSNTGSSNSSNSSSNSSTSSICCWFLAVYRRLRAALKQAHEETDRLTD